jgi:hypothetical protein
MLRFVPPLLSRATRRAETLSVSPLISRKLRHSTLRRVLSQQSRLVTAAPATRLFSSVPHQQPLAKALTGLQESEIQFIQEQARQPQTSVSLQALMRTGRGEYLHRTFGEETVQRHAATELVLIQVAGFLRRELPIRLAHRIQDLQGIPVLKDMPSVQAVCDLYAKSFLELEAFDSKIQTVEQEEAFAVAVEQIYERHSKVLVQMARGAFEFRQAVRASGGQQETQFELQEETHAFLDRFYLCRIGIRVLIGQYLALRQPPVENYVGIICSQTSPYEIVKRAIDDAAFMCTRKYGDAPEVIMSGSLDLTFPYVPTHLRKYRVLQSAVSYGVVITLETKHQSNECLTFLPTRLFILSFF